MLHAAVLFALKVLTLLAAVAQTAGFVGLFAFEALQPYKWQLLIGGTIAIVFSEGLTYVLVRQMASTEGAGGERQKEGST